MCTPSCLCFLTRTRWKGILFWMLVSSVCCTTLSGVCSLVLPSDGNPVPRRCLSRVTYNLFFLISPTAFGLCLCSYDPQEAPHGLEGVCPKVSSRSCSDAGLGLVSLTSCLMFVDSNDGKDYVIDLV